MSGLHLHSAVFCLFFSHKEENQHTVCQTGYAKKKEEIPPTRGYCENQDAADVFGFLNTISLTWVFQKGTWPVGIE
ncbi:hypothetical protein OYC64_017991 [Pagothenia borchgrevinki]|uniref:Secreted protein n=1 Tax=Pagothenia borchgrevinki TaxID=8213 RepID=A0ABD2GM55_PAGBO